MPFQSSDSAEILDAVPEQSNPRSHYRQRIQNLAYVNLDNCNGGILRNVAEGGVAVQAIAPLATNQQIHLRFELLNPRLRLEATARVAWSDAMGQAGLEFLSLSPRGRRLLKDWIFTRLLASAHQAAGTDTIFIRDCDAAALKLPGIAGKSAPVASDHEPVTRAVNLPWCPFPFSATNFTWLVDSLVLLSAVLLFSVVSLSMTNIFPSWPVGLMLLAGVASAFAAIYWFLFEVWIGATPGRTLAEFAIAGGHADDNDEDRPRFR